MTRELYSRCATCACKVDDYIRHVRRMKEEGLITENVGIGSICRRGEDQQIREIILEIEGELPDRCKIHAFGVKSNVLRFSDVCEALDSADSQAFDMRSRYTESVDKKENGFRNVALEYLKFKREIRKMLEKDESRKNLEEYRKSINT